MIGKTKSLCPECMKVVNASVIVEENKTKIRKKCSRHGYFKDVHVWDTPDLYKFQRNLWKGYDIKNRELEISFEITEKCNLKCPFCFVDSDEEKGSKYSIDEILDYREKYPGGFVTFTGGEPTLKDELPWLIKLFADKGFKTKILTNGINLDLEYVVKLKESGLEKVQLQLDSLDDKNYKILRGRPLKERKMDALKNLKEKDIDTNLFAMLASGVNDGEISDLIDTTFEYDFINGIIFSSLCYEGRFQDSLERMSNSDILGKIDQETGIKKTDFMACTGIAFYLNNILETNFNFKMFSPCDILCFVTKIDGEIIPLSRILPFDLILKLTKNKKISYDESSSFKELIKKPKTVLKFLFYIFSSFLQKKRFPIKVILVTTFHNRWNIDLEFTENCTIGSYNGENFQSFCEFNIKRNHSSLDF